MHLSIFVQGVQINHKINVEGRGALRIDTYVMKSRPKT
jgi:hypothetical protein